MLGTDFPYRDFYPKDATVVQIDLRGEHLGRRSKLDFGFIGDTKTTLRALLPKLEQNSNQQHLKDSLEHYRKTRKGLDELATANSNKGPIHPQYVARVIDKLATEDAVFTCDVGTPVIWSARYLKMNGKRRSLMLVTALNPHIGYEKAAKISLTAYREDLSLREAALKLGFVSGQQFDLWVHPEEMTHPLRG